MSSMLLKLLVSVSLTVPALAEPTRQCPQEDDLEPNDSCFTATDLTSLASFTFVNRAVSPVNEDHYRFIVGPGDTLVARVIHDVTTADIDLQLLDAMDCSTELAVAQSRDDDESLVWRNDFFGPITADLRVYVFPGSAGTCAPYDIEVRRASCTAAGDDHLEPNDSCASQPTLTSGSYPGLVLRATDPDYYRFVVGPGEGLRLVVRDLSTVGASASMRLFDPTSDPTCSSPVAEAFSTTEGLVLLHGNCDVAPRPFVARITLLQGSCSTYLLDAAVQPTTSFVDVLESNDDPFSPTALTLPFHMSGLEVSLCNWDWHAATIAPGMFLTAKVTNEDPQHIAATTVITDDSGSVFLALPETRLETERVARYRNVSASPESVLVLVAAFGDAFAPYTLDVRQSVDPLDCAGSADDSYEPNDNCGAAAPLAVEEARALRVSLADPDFYHLTVGPGEEITVDVRYRFADGDIDAQILDSGCAAVLATASTTDDDERLQFTNAGGSATQVVLRVFVPPGSAWSCNEYDLAIQRTDTSCVAMADDSFEDNDTCDSATPLGVGGQVGRVIKRGDEDWYSVTVPAGAYVVLDVAHSILGSRLALELHDAGCSGPAVTGTTIEALATSIALDNRFGAERQGKVRVFLDPDSAADCLNYILFVTSSAPIGYTAQCFGDGSGAACPCGANSTPDHPGGCKHSDGEGAILHATGLPSASVDTMHFGLTSAAHDSFAILVSGDNALPTTGACIGCGIPAFDGLRCAGGAFLRHGTRALSSEGASVNGWGPPNGPAGGIIAGAGFTVGQTRSFFAYYRTELTSGCGTGQNSSNAIRAMILP